MTQGRIKNDASNRLNCFKSFEYQLLVTGFQACSDSGGQLSRWVHGICLDKRFSAAAGEEQMLRTRERCW